MNREFEQSLLKKMSIEIAYWVYQWVSFSRYFWNPCAARVSKIGQSHVRHAECEAEPSWRNLTFGIASLTKPDTRLLLTVWRRESACHRSLNGLATLQKSSWSTMPVPWHGSRCPRYDESTLRWTAKTWLSGWAVGLGVSKTGHYTQTSARLTPLSRLFRLKYA